MTTEKLKYLIKMYGALYYQERVVEELAKQPKEEYKPLPAIPPEPTDTERNMAILFCLVIIGIALYQMFVLGTLWCFVTGFLGFMFCFPILVAAQESLEKDKNAREYAKWQYESIQKENDKLKEQRKQAAPKQKRMMDIIIQDYCKAQAESRALIKDACDALNLSYQYREYVYVCSLYQYLYTGQCETINDAYKQLDNEVSKHYYFTNANAALEQSEYAKTNQPVWVENLLKREQTVLHCVEIIRDRAFRAVCSKDFANLSGGALDYEIIKKAHSLCEISELSLYSLVSSQVEVREARRRI